MMLACYIHYDASLRRHNTPPLYATITPSDTTFSLLPHKIFADITFLDADITRYRFDTSRHAMPFRCYCAIRRHFVTLMSFRHYLHATLPSLAVNITTPLAVC